MASEQSERKESTNCTIGKKRRRKSVSSETSVESNRSHCSSIAWGIGFLPLSYQEDILNQSDSDCPGKFDEFPKEYNPRTMPFDQLQYRLFLRGACSGYETAIVTNSEWSDDSPVISDSDIEREMQPAINFAAQQQKDDEKYQRELAMLDPVLSQSNEFSHNSDSADTSIISDTEQVNNEQFSMNQVRLENQNRRCVNQHRQRGYILRSVTELLSIDGTLGETTYQYVPVSEESSDDFEYEPISASDTDTGNETAPLWLQNDKGHEADSESDNDDNKDPEIPWEERWACRNCFYKNHPMIRRCMKCWTLNSFSSKR